jgi:hypothetical protein
MPKFSHVRLVGTHFRGLDAKAVVSAFERGTRVGLEREPENEYDGNAVKVLYGPEPSIHVGYVDRDVAAYLAPLMDDGTAFSAKVVDFVQGSRVVYPLLDIERVPPALDGLPDPLDEPLEVPPFDPERDR